MMRQITYAIDLDTGMVVSRIYGEGYAWPVLDFAHGTPENGWEMPVYLEKIDERDVTGGVWSALRWTKKIPLDIKNRHRAFWGLPPVKESTWSKEVSTV